MSEPLWAYSRNFMAYPPSSHPFVGSEFNFAQCRRPRAMHLNDGFVSRYQDKQMPPTYHFGKHPYFYKPGTLRLNKEERSAWT